MKSRNGFTLVELLVVVAIIGTLVTIALVSFRNSQARGRDVERKSDLKQISSALELYYSDYGKYPNTLNFGSEFTDGKTTYFKELPTDPISDFNYIYRVVDPGVNQKYQLFAYIENTQDQDLVGTSQSCGSGKTCNFAITSSNTTYDE